MKKRVIVGAGLALLVGSVTPALAQSLPFRGLFGPAAIGEAPPQSLDITASLAGVQDKNPPRLLVNRLGDAAPSFFHSDLRAGLWYMHRGPRVNFSTSSAAAVQHYPQVDAIRWSQTGAVGLSANLQRTAFRVRQGLGYNPYYHFRVVPVTSGSGSDLADVAPPDSTFAVSSHESLRSNTEVGWAYRPTTRSTFDFEYRREYIDFTQPGTRDWVVHDTRGGWNRALTRNVTAVMGYGYHRRDFQGDVEPVIRHNIDLGVSYQNAVQSPRTTFNFSMGSAVISLPRSPRTPSTPTNFLRVLGQANLDHRLSRTWRLGAAYERGLQYIEGVDDVFLADRITGSLVGYFGRRVEVRATTDYSNGGLRFATHQRGYDTQASTGRVRIAVSRSLAAQVEYLYYRFMFSDAVTLPTGTPSRDNRHRIRVGLTTWFPLLP